MSDAPENSIWNPNSITFSNINTYWGHRFIAALRDQGITRFVISPGSRNTPFTFACSRMPGIEVEVVVDERSAAFFAVGWSKSSGLQPVALICTSGSALAHYLPAIIEARYGHVPLLVLSADRPDELQDCHAGQTIDQQRIFGNYVSEFWHVTDPALGFWKYSKQSLEQTCKQLKKLAPLPIHINQPFRDPLTPGVEDGLREQLIQELDAQEEPESAYQGESLRSPIEFTEYHGKRVLLIIGPQCVSAVSREPLEALVSAFGADLGAPIICDGLSSFRFGNIRTGAHYDLYLRSDGVASDLKPDAVFVLGDVPTSKVLRQRLAEWSASVSVLTFDSDQRDAGISGHWQNLYLDSREALFELTIAVKSAKSADGYKQQWETFEAHASAAI